MVVSLPWDGYVSEYGWDKYASERRHTWGMGFEF